VARTRPLQDREYQVLVRRLVAARERAGLTQVDAARRLGHTQSYVAKCERLYRRIDVVELLQLLRLYRVAPHDFFGPWTSEEAAFLEAEGRREHGRG